MDGLVDGEPDRPTDAGNGQGWLPVRVKFDGAEALVDWAYFGQKRLSEPFFSGSVQRVMQMPFNQAFRRTTTAKEMLAIERDTVSVPPTAFIFHASRCGSTLMSQILAALPSHIVASEPPMVDSLLRAHFYIDGLDRSKQLDWVRSMVNLLGSPRMGEREYVVKLDAWTIFDSALLDAAFPETPWIFLYRDPLEIAVSQMRQRASYTVPNMIGPLQLSIDPTEANQLSGEEYVARVLGEIFATAAKIAALSPVRMTLVHYGQLPVAMWHDLAHVFRVPLDAKSLNTMTTAAKWDAKNPYFEFAADSEAKQREATPVLRRLIDQWVRPHYDALEAARKR